MRVGCNLLTRADDPRFVQAAAGAVRSLVESDLRQYNPFVLVTTQGPRCTDFYQWQVDLRAVWTNLDMIDVPAFCSFAEGRNSGYTFMGMGKFDLLLEFDNDNLFPNYWFEPMLRFLESHPRAGLVSPGTIMAEKWELCDTPTVRIDYEGMHYTDMLWRVNKEARLCRAAYAGRTGRVRYPPVLKRSQCLQEVGLYDEGFRGGSWEDWDECVRVAAGGWETWTCLDSFVFHWTAWERTVQGNWAGGNDDADQVANRNRFFDKWPEAAEFMAAYMESRHGLFSIYNEG